MATVVPDAVQATPAAMQMEDRFGEALIIKQEMALVELFGIEAKNRYRVWKAGADPDVRKTDGLEQTMFIHEESKCFERICCGPNRTLTLIVHQGADKNGPELLRLHKPFHCHGSICFRPNMTISDSAGTSVGVIKDPFACCAMNQSINDHTGTAKYAVKGSICQLGLCCPCCGDVKFEVKDLQGGPKGEIRKIFDGCSELLLGTNKFKVTFPTDATEPDKSLLLGATMLVDLEYFEVKKQKNSG